MNGNQSKTIHKGGCDSAAWGRRGMPGLTLVLVTSLSFCQRSTVSDAPGGTRHGKMTPERQSLADLSNGTPAANQSVRVIVQFKQTPRQHHFDKVQAHGGRMSAQLGLVKGGAFALPVSALNALANDDEVA